MNKQLILVSIYFLLSESSLVIARQGLGSPIAHQGTNNDGNSSSRGITGFNGGAGMGMGGFGMNGMGMGGMGMNGFGMNGMGMGGFGMNGMGMGGFGMNGMGMGGMGMNRMGYTHNPMVDKITEVGKAAIQGIEKQSQQFSQNAQSQKLPDLDKLTPPDKTAEMLQELNKGQEQLASQMASRGDSNAIVDDIVKSLQTNFETQTEILKAAATAFIKPAALSEKKIQISNQERIAGFSGGKNNNPLSVAMNAQPINSSPDSLGHTNKNRAFFPGIKTYNSPKK